MGKRDLNYHVSVGGLDSITLFLFGDAAVLRQPLLRGGTMAEVERGIAAEVTEAGVRAVSLDRPGIVTPPLKNLYTGTLAEQDRVLFVLFPDGEGFLLGKI